MITSTTTVTAALYQLRPIDFLGICLSPKVLRGFRPCHEETLRSNLQWLVFSILKWMDGWIHANLQRERIRRLHPPIPQNPTRPTRTSKHTCRLEPFTSYRRLPHIMRLSSFHQTQATSSCGAQPSPAPAEPPYCGTYGPPLPAVVAPAPPSTIGNGGCSSSSGGAIFPLDFPSPRFAACRNIKSSSKRAGFTLVSNATQRAWEAVKPLRECQFGQVFLAVEVIHTSSGRGWERASSSPKYFAIKVRELVLDYEKKTAMKQHVHPRILQQQRS